MMEENMVQKIETGIPMLTSLEVAEMVGKDHKMLMRDIRRYTSQFEQCKIAPFDFWEESSYVDSNKQKRPCYLITKKGCEFIAHKLTGVKGTAFTARYINRFHEMEEELAVPAISGGKIEKLLEVIQKQSDQIQKQMDLIEGMNNRITNLEKKKRPRATSLNQDNPFNSENEYTERYKALDRMVTRIAELRRTDKVRILHLLYREIDTRHDISLNAYKAVLQYESGKPYSMLETIARNDWIFEAAEDLCMESIERHEVFAETGGV